MKTFILTAFATLLFFAGAAAPKKYRLLNSTASFWTPTNWSPTGTPANGDTVVIPASKVLTLATDLTLSNMYIDIYGGIVLAGNNLKMILENTSTINVHTTGWIDGDKASQQIVMGNIIFKGSDPLVTGPKLATNTSKAFVPYVEFRVLPVTFLSFNVSRTTAGDYLVKWTTASEVNAAGYEVERSNTGTTWKTIAAVSATGFTMNTYSYTDKIAGGTVYYRIKQLDTDGTFTYTSVNMQKTAAASIPTINAFAQNVQVQFAQGVKGSVTVEVIGLNGMVAAKQTTAAATGTIVLATPALHGIYIVRVTEGASTTAKQILL